jgi:hypothetical protein
MAEPGKAIYTIAFFIVVVVGKLTGPKINLII